MWLAITPCHDFGAVMGLTGWDQLKYSKPAGESFVGGDWNESCAVHPLADRKRSGNEFEKLCPKADVSSSASPGPQP